MACRVLGACPLDSSEAEAELHLLSAGRCPPPESLNPIGDLGSRVSRRQPAGYSLGKLEIKPLVRGLAAWLALIVLGAVVDAALAALPEVVVSGNWSASPRITANEVLLDP